MPEELQAPSTIPDIRTAFEDKLGTLIARVVRLDFVRAKDRFKIVCRELREHIRGAPPKLEFAGPGQMLLLIEACFLAERLAFDEILFEHQSKKIDGYVVWHLIFHLPDGGPSSGVSLGAMRQSGKWAANVPVPAEARERISFILDRWIGAADLCEPEGFRPLPELTRLDHLAVMDMLVSEAIRSVGDIECANQARARHELRRALQQLIEDFEGLPTTDHPAIPWSDAQERLILEPAAILGLPAPIYRDAKERAVVFRDPLSEANTYGWAHLRSSEPQMIRFQSMGTMSHAVRHLKRWLASIEPTPEETRNQNNLELPSVTVAPAPVAAQQSPFEKQAVAAPRAAAGKRKLTQDEINKQVASHFKRNPKDLLKINRDQLASIVGCSTGAISNCPQWRQVQIERNKRKGSPPANKRIGMEIADEIASTSKWQDDQELEALIEEQRRDDRRKRI